MSTKNGPTANGSLVAGDVKRHLRHSDPVLYDRVSRMHPVLRRRSILSTLSVLNNSTGRQGRRRTLKRASSLRDTVKEKAAGAATKIRHPSRSDSEMSYDINQNIIRRKSSITSGGMVNIFRVRKQMKNKAQSIRQRKLHRIFRALAKVTIVVQRLCEMHYQQVRNDATKNLTFAQLHVTPADDLMFDVTQYKANKELRISKESRQILMKPPKERTEQEIYQVTIALRNLKSIAEYPVRMQRRVASVGWYESYDSKRVIVREGHNPHYFYFVISGSVVVTVMDREKNRAQTVAILKRGDSFGELAFLNRSRRTATVTSREFIELLCVSAEDFTSIFMSGGVKTLNDPDHGAFIKGINFLRGWPLELLEENPKMCIFNYFKSGTVLVKDSKQSDWIYIVKSGSCSVLKKLKQVKPRLKQRKPADRPPDDECQDKGRDIGHLSVLELKTAELVDKKKEDLKKNLALKLLMPKITTSVEFDDTRSEYSRVPSATTIDRGSGRHTPADGRVLQHETKRIFSGIRQKVSNSGDGDAVAKKKEENVDPPTSAGFATGPFLARTLKRLEIDELAEKKKWDKTSTLTGLSLEDEYLVQGNQRTIAYDLNYGYKNEAEPDFKPIFVRVQTLVKGAVFGLTEMLFDSQPSLSLVSNGAECIVISKKLFLEHADDDQMTRLRLEERPYITDEEMQSNLEKQLHWDMYRKMTMRRAAMAVKQRKSNKKESLRFGVLI